MGAYHANYRSPNQLLFQAFLWYIGAALGHSAACVWNDICDRDFDRLVGMAVLPILDLLLTAIDLSPLEEPSPCRRYRLTQRSRVFTSCALCFSVRSTELFGYQTVLHILSHTYKF
jgi:hypothetical protein